jgi:hypothetical protein
LKLGPLATRFSWFCPVLVPLLALQPCQQAKAWAADQPAALASRVPHTSRQRPRPAALFSTPQSDSPLPKGPTHRLASAADPTDPYIIAQATALNNNPTQIFAFVRDQVAFQAYHGSVRGARGTLWTMGGNSLDRASLLIALLGAAGYTAQYVQGTLTTGQEQTLISSMFSAPSRVVGCIPAGTTLASPTTDPNLQTAIADHYWVEYGAQNTPMDPNFSGATIGQTFGTATQTFTSIPSALKQMVTITLNVETSSYYYGISSVTLPLGGSSVLSGTFESALLVGMPVSIANTVSGGTSGGGFLGGFTTTTYTYTPYFLMGQGSTDIELDPIVYGTVPGTSNLSQYQESLTLFSGTFVSGIFLVVTAPDINGNIQTYNHTIVDRIGFANRQANLSNPGNLSPTIPNTTTDPPVILSTDIVTVNLLPGLQSSAAFANQQTRVNTEQTRLSNLEAAAQAIVNAGVSPTAQQTQTLTSALTAQTDLEIALAELATMTFASTADYVLGQLKSEYLSDAYYNSPRIIIGASTASGVFSLDLMKRDIYIVPSPGQNTSAAFYFENNRGLVESAGEAQVLTEVLGQPSIDIADVFATLPSDGSGTVAITPDTAGYVAMPNLSADALAYISLALANNKAVIAPAQTPTVNGQPVNMWLEIDMTTGETVSQSDTGYHIGALEFIVALLTALKGRDTNFIGSIAGFGATGYAFAAGVLSGVAAIAAGAASTKGKVACIQGGSCSTSPLAPYVITAFGQLDTIIKNLPSCCGNGEGKTLAGQLVGGLKFGVTQSENILLRALPADPDVFPFLSSDIIPGPAAVPPGSTPAVNLTLTQDQFFTQPYSGGDVPTVFIANIQNTGPTAETFNLTVGTIPGYNLIPSVPSITVPAGQTGQIGICAVPTGNSAPPAILSASVSAVGNSSVTSASSTGFSAAGSVAACAVTNDTIPSVADAQQMINEALGKAAPNNDINGDKVVNAVDVQIVIGSILGYPCN